MGNIIGIRNGDEHPFSDAAGFIQGRHTSPVFTAQVADSRIPEFPDYFNGGIGRTIIDDYELEILIALCEDAADTLPQEGCRVVYGHDD